MACGHPPERWSVGEFRVHSCDRFLRRVSEDGSLLGLLAKISVKRILDRLIFFCERTGIGVFRSGPDRPSCALGSSGRGQHRGVGVCCSPAWGCCVLAPGPPFPDLSQLWRGRARPACAERSVRRGRCRSEPGLGCSARPAPLPAACVPTGVNSIWVFAANERLGLPAVEPTLTLHGRSSRAEGLCERNWGGSLLAGCRPAARCAALLRRPQL